MNLRWRIAQAAEIRWWRHYLAQKEVGAYLEWKKDYWRKLLNKLEIELRPGGRVLDAGCGPAGIFSVLETQEVIAIDPLLNQYQDRIAHFRPDAYPWVLFQATALEDLEVGEPFELVCCLNAINHVADLGVCMEKLWEATQNSGSLLLSVDAHNFSVLKHLFRLLPGDILHPHQHSLEDYEQMLISAGFEIQQRLRFRKGLIFDYFVILAKKREDG